MFNKRNIVLVVLTLLTVSSHKLEANGFGGGFATGALTGVVLSQAANSGSRNNSGGGDNCQQCNYALQQAYRTINKLERKIEKLEDKHERHERKARKSSSQSNTTNDDEDYEREENYDY